jgi:hypothetical protein
MSWVADNCKFSLRTAQLYMKLAEYLADGDPAKAQRVALLGLREVGAFLLQSKATPEENERELKKKEAKDVLMEHWLSGGPLERRAFIAILTLQKALPLNVGLRQLRWLAKNDGDGSVAAIPELENPGLEIPELLQRTPFDRQLLIERGDAEKLFALAGKPAATIAVEMCKLGYFAATAAAVAAHSLSHRVKGDG